jgi:hypothetical protein
MLTTLLLVGLGILIGLVFGSVFDRYDVLYSCHRCNAREHQYKYNAIVRNADALASLGERMREARDMMCPHCSRRMEYVHTEVRSDGSVDVRYEHDCSA